MKNNSSEENISWVKTHRSLLESILKTGAVLGVLITLIIPTNVWPSPLTKLVVAVVCAIIYLALTLFRYYRPNNKF